MRVQLVSCDTDRHGEGCDCGACDARGRSYGVGIFPAGTDPHQTDPLDVLYAASEEAARHNARLECSRLGYTVVAAWQEGEE